MVLTTRLIAHQEQEHAQSRLFSKDEHVYAQLARFPGSHYMRSKHAILPFIHDVLNNLDFHTVLDACSGSGAVSYLLKSMGKSVTSNDMLSFCYHTARACVANNVEYLAVQEVEQLLLPHALKENFIEKTFQGLYFSDDENKWLDNLVANIHAMTSPYKQSIAFASVVRACLRRRPRGTFTYTGLRYDDGRRDLQISLEQHFLNAVALFNAATFDNGQSHAAWNCDIFSLP